MHFGKKTSVTQLRAHLTNRIIRIATGIIFAVMLCGGGLFLVMVIQQKVYPSYTYLQTAQPFIQPQSTLQQINVSAFNTVYDNFLQKTESSSTPEINYPANPFRDPQKQPFTLQEISSTTESATTSQPVPLPEFPKSLP